MSKGNHPSLVFNNGNVSKANSQKRLGVVFDNRSWFDEYLKMIINKADKTTGLLRKLQNVLRRSDQLIIYKAIVRLTVAIYMTKIRIQVWCISCNNKSNRKPLVAILSIGSGVASTPSLVQEAILF